VKLFDRFVKWYCDRVYKQYKAALLKATEKAHPLIQYPFMMFVELELDGIYEKEGIVGVMKAVQDWGPNYAKRMQDAVDKLFAPPPEPFVPAKGMRVIVNAHDGNEDPPAGTVIDPINWIVKLDNGVIVQCGGETELEPIEEGNEHR